MSKIIITEKESGKQIIVDSVLQASEYTGVDRRKIAKALSDPFNWVHQDDPKRRVLSNGNVSYKRQGCAFDFNRVSEEDYAIELWPVDDFHDSQKFKSMYKAAKFLGVSRVFLYRLKEKATIGEVMHDPVRDPEGYEWLIVFNEPTQEVPDNFKHHK